MGLDRPWFHGVSEEDIYRELETPEYQEFVNRVIEDGMRIGKEKAERSRA